MAAVALVAGGDGAPGEVPGRQIDGFSDMWLHTPGRPDPRP